MTVDLLQEMLSYIDKHIKEKVSVEKLASKAGFSQYYFCRAFHSNVGYSVMEYVRNRRLAFAAAEFSSGRRITDISTDYGFKTYSGFSKAFRRYFGCSPENFRKQTLYEVTNPPNLRTMKQ